MTCSVSAFVGNASPQSPNRVKHLRLTRKEATNAEGKCLTPTASTINVACTPRLALTTGLNLSTIGLIMSATSSDASIAAVLFGKVRRAVLALLFGHADESFYLRQIERTIGSSHGAVHRELGHLVQAGLVVRTNRGKQVYYQANRHSPVFADLRGLIVRTAGVADVLRGSLAPLAERISIALVYGSMARGTEKTESDIDVMVVGDVTFGEVVQSLHSAEQELRREVNPSVFPAEEFRERAQSGEHFVTSVLEDAKVFLIGDSNELERSAGRGQA